MSTLSVNTLQRQSGSNAPDGVRLLTQQTRTDVNRTLSGDSGWITHLSGSVTLPKQSNVIVQTNFGMTREAGSVEAFARLQWAGTVYYGYCMSKQSTANHGGAASGSFHFANQAAGTYAWELQVRNTQGGTTCILNYWDGGDAVRNGDDVVIWYQG